MFNRNKTKWRPLYVYQDDKWHYMVQVRKDKKTGLFEFTTKRIGRSTYHLNYNIDNQKVLDEVLQEEEW